MSDAPSAYLPEDGEAVVAFSEAVDPEEVSYFNIRISRTTGELLVALDDNGEHWQSIDGWTRERERLGKKWRQRERRRRGR